MSQAYEDVAPLMETAAMREGGIRFRVTGFGYAVNIRQRCYRFRKARQAAAKEAMGDIPGVTASTPFDTLVISIEDIQGNVYAGNKKPANPDQAFFVIIRERPPLPGTLFDADGNAIDFVELPKQEHETFLPGDELELGLDITPDEDL